MKILINADDFGWSTSCTEAILQCFEKEYITSTTMCANGEAFEEAVRLVKQTPYKDRVGIHFVLTEGRPLTEAIGRNPRFCDDLGVFHGKVNRYMPLDKVSRHQVLEELTAQAQRFMDSGLVFHHADSHHHIHTAPVILPLVRDVADKFEIKQLRIHRNIGKISALKKWMKQLFNIVLGKKAYSDCFGSFEDVASRPEILGRKGVLEIMCHPDLDGWGILVDREGGDYKSPSGTPMEKQMMLLGEKSDYGA